LIFVHYILQEGTTPGGTIIRLRNITTTVLVGIIRITHDHTYPSRGMMCRERLANGTHPYNTEVAWFNAHLW
jgi:hypothetical protein